MMTSMCRLNNLFVPAAITPMQQIKSILAITCHEDGICRLILYPIGPSILAALQPTWLSKQVVLHPIFVTCHPRNLMNVVLNACTGLLVQPSIISAVGAPDTSQPQVWLHTASCCFSLLVQWSARVLPDQGSG